jgi:archaellum component FlaC
VDLQLLLKRVKTYFIIAVALKIVLAAASLKVADPFLLGFVLPLLVMLIYWAIGLRVRDKWNTQLTLAKFADSVYYLGFLFTVASIIICLLDINSIGDSLNGMAIRFGAAMVSTAIGMLARVLHTGFKVDTNDAVKSVEERAIHSAESLAMSFDAASQQLEVFRDQVMAASKEAVQSVHEQINAISQHSTTAMDTFFSNATRQSNDAFECILKQANDASTDLLTTINGLCEKSEQTLNRMESHALDFGKKAQDRLDQTLFPDDLFAQKLNPAIETLSGTTDTLNEGVSTLALDVKTAARMVGTAIRSLNTKTETIGQAVAAVGAIVENQERLVESMKLQGSDVMDRVERIQKDYLDSLDDQREDFLADIKAIQQVFAKIVEKLEELRTVVRDESAVERMTQEVTGALTTISRAGIKSNEAFAENLRSTLVPLVEAVAASNDAHKSLVTSVESNHRSIETANSHLMNELMNKIDLISTSQERSSSASEEVTGSSLDSIVDATQALRDVVAADVRTA